MGRIEQVRRIIYLRDYLDSCPRPHAREVAESLGVSRRTLYRDLRLLRTAQAELASFPPLNPGPSKVHPNALPVQAQAIGRAALSERPYFDVPMICLGCARAHGAAPSAASYPGSSIYEFFYESTGKRWRILFCCPRRERAFMSDFPVTTESIEIVWRQADPKPSAEHITAN